MYRKKQIDLNVGKDVIKQEIESLELLEESLNYDFSDAVDIIQSTIGRVIVTGMGKSGHIARKIAATMASIGIPAFFVHPRRS